MPTALNALVENRITGFPVIDDDWKLVRCADPFTNHLYILVFGYTGLTLWVLDVF